MATNKKKNVSELLDSHPGVQMTHNDLYSTYQEKGVTPDTSPIRDNIQSAIGSNYSTSGNAVHNAVASATGAIDKEAGLANAIEATYGSGSGSNNSIKGAPDDLVSTANSQFSQSDSVTAADSERSGALSGLSNLASKESILSSGVIKGLEKEFEVPSEVTQADAYLTQQLEKIQSGKTSYSDQVQAMLDKIMNREKFSYDVDSDQLFQQALASAMNSGKQAMQDTIGQASALTGGYGSTYATSAGNQAYNAFIEDAYDNLPQYYQMALEAYQMEGDEMYRQFGMVSELDDKEYNRNVAAYDATYQHRNQLYNEAYGQYRDSKSDAFAMANIELNEYGQRVNDAYNYYNIVSTEEDKAYRREYNSWQDSINQVWQVINAQNSDWQNQTNRDFQASESQKQRDWQSAEAEKERAFTASENAKNRAASRSSGSGGGSGLLSLFANEAEANKAMSEAANSKPVEQFKSSIMTQSEFNRRGKKATSGKNTVQYDNYQEYVGAKLDEWYNDGKGKLSTNQYIYLAQLEW